jgi:hypothetical protein
MAYYGMIFYESIDERYEEGVGEVAAPWDNRWPVGDTAGMELYR